LKDFDNLLPLNYNFSRARTARWASRFPVLGSIPRVYTSFSLKMSETSLKDRRPTKKASEMLQKTERAEFFTVCRKTFRRRPPRSTCGIWNGGVCGDGATCVSRTQYKTLHGSACACTQNS